MALVLYCHERTRTVLDPLDAQRAIPVILIYLDRSRGIQRKQQCEKQNDDHP
jgi:hypothetical protein